MAHRNGLGWDEETVKFLQQAMHDTVLSGTARRARIPGISVAGKTGTAQPASAGIVPDVPKSEMPERFREHAWFMGFAPAEDPGGAFAVVVEHSGLHGGEIAAPVARQVLEAYFGDRVEVTGQ